MKRQEVTLTPNGPGTLDALSQQTLPRQWVPRPNSEHPAPPGPIVLNTWKDIALYLGRGVRTLQRWERSLGLPVHRIGTGGRAPVIAFPREIQEWLHNATQEVRNRCPPRPSSAMEPRTTQLDAEIDSYKATLKRLEECVRELRRIIAVRSAGVMLPDGPYHSHKDAINSAKSRCA